MRIFLLCLLLVSLNAFAQQNNEGKTIPDIAAMERQGHLRIAAAAAATAASANFDVKYYRCEWEVDPAVRYIKGTVTVYYVVTVATNSLALDLMDALTVKNVTQRGVVLTKSQL